MYRGYIMGCCMTKTAKVSPVITLPENDKVFRIELSTLPPNKYYRKSLDVINYKYFPSSNVIDSDLQNNNPLSTVLRDVALALSASRLKNIS